MKKNIFIFVIFIESILLVTAIVANVSNYGYFVSIIFVLYGISIALIVFLIIISVIECFCLLS